MLVESNSNVFGDIAIANLLQQDMSAEALMVQVQILMAKEFDDQLQDISQKIKFLNDVKKQYRDNINVLQKLTAQNPVSEKNGKQWVHASFEQMDGVCNALVEYEYNLENKETKEKPMNDWGKYFAEGAATKDVKKQNEIANKTWYEESSVSNRYRAGAYYGDATQNHDVVYKLKDKNSDLPFYWKNGEKYDDGSPKFSVMVGALDNMLEQINNFMSDIEEDTEQLSVQMNQLTSQRKSILEGASQIIRKLEEVATNTVSKL